MAEELRKRGWAQFKMYAESPPVLWVFPEGMESAALSVAALQAGGRWIFQISRLIEYPCEAAGRVADVLDDVLRDRVAGRTAGRRPADDDGVRLT